MHSKNRRGECDPALGGLDEEARLAWVQARDPHRSPIERLEALTRAQTLEHAIKVLTGKAVKIGALVSGFLLILRGLRHSTFVTATAAAGGTAMTAAVVVIGAPHLPSGQPHRDAVPQTVAAAPITGAPSASRANPPSPTLAGGPGIPTRSHQGHHRTTTSHHSVPAPRVTAPAVRPDPTVPTETVAPTTRSAPLTSLVPSALPSRIGALPSRMLHRTQRVVHRTVRRTEKTLNRVTQTTVPELLPSTVDKALDPVLSQVPPLQSMSGLLGH